MITTELPAATCDRSTRAGRSLLGYGALAGPLYVAVSLAQALLRRGFELTRHEWSLLADGPSGWIQVVNFCLSGAMVLAFAVGLRRALTPGRGARWAPRLIGLYGLGLVGAGVFRADPALGFPPGTADGPAAISWHGLLHLVSATVGFAGLIAACFVMAARFATEGRRGWAIGSRLVGLAFATGFAGVASGAGGAVTTLGFTAAVVLGWAWLSAVAIDRYRVLAAR
jgi:hypothetical protein